MFTLKDLKYLVHGGRISHLKGLLASMLRIKPIIKVTKEDGVYETVSQQRTFNKSVKTIVDLLKEEFGNKPIRIQLVHAGNEADLAVMKALIEEKLNATFLPSLTVATTLGAHTGPTLLGVGYGLKSVFDNAFKE